VQRDNFGYAANIIFISLFFAMAIFFCHLSVPSFAADTETGDSEFSVDSLLNPKKSTGATISCQKCDFSNAAGVKFCGNCGTPIIQKNICPACKFESKPNAKFCGNCGATLSPPAATAEIKTTKPKKNEAEFSPAAFMIKGDEFMKAGDYEKAKNEYKNAFDLDPESLECNLKLGKAYTKANYFDNADLLFSKILELDTTCVEARFYLSINLRHKLDTKSEESNLKDLLAICPNHFRALNNLGCLNIKSKRFEDAIFCLKKAVTLNPDYFIARINLAAALLYKNKTENAQKVLDKVISIKPNYYLSYYNLGVLNNIKNKFEDAIIQFDKALKLKPNHIESIVNKGAVLYRKGKYEEAVAVLKSGLEINKNCGEIHLNLAACYEKLSMKTEAAEESQKAITQNPNLSSQNYPDGIFIGAISEPDDDNPEFSSGVSIEKSR